MATDPTTARIAACLSMPGMNKVLLAHLAGVHRNTLDDYDRPDWNPMKQTLDAIVRVVEGLERLRPQ